MSICDDAVAFLQASNGYDSHNRQEGLDDLRFSLGEQWSAQMQNARHLESRPWFVINETDTFCRQVLNQMRQQRPRIKAHGVNNSSDKKIADIITGITRHIEQLSDADNAYDTAAEFAVRMGWGYFRLTGDYCRDDSFDQDIRIQPVYNPFSVSFDPHSKSPDGSDQSECVISDWITKKAFKQLYPGADEQSFTVRAIGDYTGEWLQKDSIRLAEYYKIEREREKLIHLSDGSAWWKDELPKEDNLGAAGIKIKGDRDSWRKRVKWYKCTAIEVLEERTLPGRYIPVVPVYGGMIVVDGKTRRFGIVRMAKDPQRMLNYWDTAITEMVALAAKAKWLGPAQAFETFEREWERANVVAYPVLKYNHKDETDVPIPPPTRIAPEPPPQGAMAAAELAHQNLQRVLGMFDPAQRIAGNASGKALNAEQQQSDVSNFHLYDNLTRSIKHCGRIILDWIPSYYGKRRVLRIIGEDGRPDLVTINDNQAIGKIENDLTVGEYDVVMETGPGYNSKRQEAFAWMSEMAKAWPPFMQIAGDLVMRNADAPGAEIIADRLAASNPLAQIDDKSDIPPRAQMMIKQLQQQLQQAGQQLQQAGVLSKMRQDVEGVREAGESHREMIRQQGEDRRQEMKSRTEIAREVIEDKTWRHDIAMREHGKLGAAEIDGIVKLLLAEKQRQANEVEQAANREEAELDRRAAKNGAANG